MTKRIGILTAGSDCPGLNSAIRAIGKCATGSYGMEVIGFQDGFQGLIEDRWVTLEGSSFSGILTAGGTILGTSRTKPHAVVHDDQVQDLSDYVVQTYNRHHLDALVCIGGKETQESALRLHQKGVNIITLPKAIDNDLAMTDEAIGFNTAQEVAAESIDRLHSTAHSLHRIIIVELMGRNTGWLPLSAGIAGGADVILIPEIPYDIHQVAEAISERNQAGKGFSIIAVAERIISKEQLAFRERLYQMNNRARPEGEREKISEQLDKIENRRTDTTFHLSNRLEEMTGLQSRITILGYLLRGGAPSAADRILATELGTASVEMAEKGQFGVMVAMRDGKVQAVPLEQVGSRHKTVPVDHNWILSARRVGTCFGD